MSPLAIDSSVRLEELIQQERLLDYLNQLDWNPGKTKHDQQYCAFLHAAAHGVDPAFAFSQVAGRIVGAGGRLDLYQARRQQERAIAFIAGKNEPSPSTAPRAPRTSFSRDALQAIARNVDLPNPGEMLQALSPFNPEQVTAVSFLERLYYPGEIVVGFTTFKSQGQFLYQVGSASNEALPAGGQDGIWFLVQPVDGQFHPNPRQQHKLSRRSEEAVTAWRYLVLESDEADTADWIRVLVQFPLRIVAIYTSGGRSVHALVRVDAPSKADWDEFKAAIKTTVVTLGADPGALSAVRLSRLPQCWRGDRRQALLYLNPAADSTPIIGTQLRAEQGFADASEEVTA